ncbi:MAG: sensor histidine kinase [bacterium]|nr:sensor histidine kinase [bacterium]
MQDESQFVLVFVVSSLTILLILILVILFVVAYQKRVATQRLKLDTIERDHQKQLLQATLTVQERERKRIASDLHDDIGSLLSALKLNVQFLEDSEQNERQKEFLTKTRIKLESGIEQVRRISHDMYPPELQKLGLWASIKELFANIEESKKVHTSIHGIPTDFRFDIVQELAVYRVLQELVTNSLRHSKADTLKLTIQNSKESVIIQYSDNGTGMNESQLKTGLGIMNMRSRIEAIYGTIAFESSKGIGTQTTIILPHGNSSN